MIGIADQIKEVYKEYVKLQGKLFILLGKQRLAGDVCDCVNPEQVILPTEDGSLRAYCAQCGGEIMEE